MQICLIILMAVCLAQTVFSKNYKKVKNKYVCNCEPKKQIRNNNFDPH